jgi:phospholipid-transporting ATPase
MVPLDAESVLLRGSCLRNTAWIYGVAIYTGHETKIMKNSTRAKAKKSYIELSTNRYIILTILIQTALCIFAGCYEAIKQIRLTNENLVPYLDFDVSYSVWGLMPWGFGTWFLALMNFVAISLMVTLEMVKFF